MFRKFVYSVCVLGAVTVGCVSATPDTREPDVWYCRPWPQNKYLSDALIRFPVLQDLFGYQVPVQYLC